jgi:hypothetical protein
LKVGCLPREISIAVNVQRASNTPVIHWIWFLAITPSARPPMPCNLVHYSPDDRVPPRRIGNTAASPAVTVHLLDAYGEDRMTSCLGCRFHGHVARRPRDVQRRDLREQTNSRDPWVGRCWCSWSRLNVRYASSLVNAIEAFGNEDDVQGTSGLLRPVRYLSSAPSTNTTVQ